MTIPVPETNPEKITAPVNPYAGLPKPPMSPPSKATTKVPLILASRSKVTFPPSMGKYLEKMGVGLETLQFDTKRLLIGSVRGGNLSPHKDGTPGNLFFLLRGFRLGDNILLRVVEAPAESEIKVGYVFCDIDTNNCLMPDSDLHIARYPILSLGQESVKHGD